MCDNQTVPLKTYQSTSSQSRLTFISKACTGCILAAGSIWIPQTSEQERREIRAVLFDGFALFDPRRVSVITEEISRQLPNILGKPDAGAHGRIKCQIIRK